MTEPDRLSGHTTGLGGALLRSARGDAPSDTARGRTAAALGLVAGTMATTSTAAATSAASKVGAFGVVAFAKWMAVGAIGAAVALGAVQAAVGPSAPVGTVGAPSAAARSSGPPPASHGPGIRALAPSASAEVPSPALSETARGPAPAPTGAPVQSLHAPARPEVASAASSLTEELSVLDRARAALAAGDARGALDALDAHDRRFEGGALGPEALVLRIEALAAHGDDAEAMARADAFLAADPGSLQARRVRSIRSAIEARQKP
jgi:hypothetical protein